MTYLYENKPLDEDYHLDLIRLGGWTSTAPIFWFDVDGDFRRTMQPYRDVIDVRSCGWQLRGWKDSRPKIRTKSKRKPND